MRSPAPEQHPRLSIDMLRLNGVFCQPLRDVTFECRGLTVTIHYNSFSEEVVIKWGNPPTMQRVFFGIVTKDLTFGPRFYFFCHETGSITRELHLVGGKWGSRRAFRGLLPRSKSRAQLYEQKIHRIRDRLLGENGQPSAIGRNRSRLIRAIRPWALIQHRFPELREVFEQEDARQLRSRQDRSSRSSGPFSTAQALEHGRRLSVDEVVLRLDSWHHSPVPREHIPPSPSDTRLGFIEEHPALDIRTLVKTDLMDEVIAGRTLEWRDRLNSPVVAAALLMDRRAPEASYLVLQPLSQGSAITSQGIELSTTAAGRLYMKCPRSGERKDILFLRERWFASPTANRLCHRSQRKRC